MKKLLSTIEAAELLSVKPSRIRMAVFRKEIPFIKIGRLVRFDPEALRVWVEKQTVGT